MLCEECNIDMVYFKIIPLTERSKDIGLKNLLTFLWWHILKRQNSDERLLLFEEQRAIVKTNKKAHEKLSKIKQTMNSHWMLPLLNIFRKYVLPFLFHVFFYFRVDKSK